ncbi:hypothetical protein Back11_33270 [Paenibacillus baekrokdamisoli]|uniref:Uncharacterized protein n=1 Tax=Paenibacillus baekrokdamisoli TaxID=1712516 RepID=A0A3G9IUN2_9BACL|nr:hypothetical protein [Paenibacillus baekrokdamisoli]MBB3072906.1 uncharacterized protein YcfL [Paenibacillus baekrokdamisoli]BBH21982.1 hypothetical protein Back11_33270 [Paenibacillus baekrokdamisoli]
MERSSIKLVVAVMLMTVMLAGCGAQSGNSVVSNNGQETVGTDGSGAAGIAPNLTQVRAAA